MLRKLMKTIVFSLACVFVFGQAHALPAGSATLNISNGLFIDSGTTQSASGDFVFQNTLPAPDALSRYSASARISVVGDGVVFDETFDLGLTTLNDLAATPEGAVIGQIAAAIMTSLSGFLSLDLGLGPLIEFNYIVSPDAGSTFDDATGNFLLTSTQDYSSLLTGAGIPDDTSAAFDATLALQAIPVPAAAPLLASAVLLLGFAGMRRRQAAI